MTHLTKASHQWASRPDDERFISLPTMHDFMNDEREHSRSVVVPNRHLEIQHDDDNIGLTVVRKDGEHNYAPRHWAFGQLASLADAPAAFLRTLPSPLTADIINYGLRYKRSIEDVGVLLYKNGNAELRAATGPNYGRVWNADIVDALIRKFGDGVTGDWKVPGEFGKDVKVTKANTTLYASDRDMFVFLADEKNRVNVENRRDGQSGSLARGFFVWNSEVGKTVLGIGTFLFDFVCMNRIVWGAEGYAEIRVRHTAGAPLRWMDEVQPVLQAYANSSAKPIEDAVKAAQAKKVDDVADFLATRFSKRLVGPMMQIHEIEEGRPIETLWDVTTAATAYARGIGKTDDRLDIERAAGKVMQLAR